MRTERHEVVYQCDQCPNREVVHGSPFAPINKQTAISPEGWFKTTGPLRYATRKVVVTVDLCSAKCLWEWAGKQRGDGE